MQNLLMIVFYALTFYAFLPGLISRTFGFRAFKRGRVKREIALTFDDGPDPRYTAQLLDLLKRYDAKATFFVVGAHADKHPELLRRMREEGHVIGIHNYEHKTNWFMRPRTVKRHIAQTEEVIKQATGQGTVYYRPPWGIVNVFDYSLRNFQIVLWSSLFGDWRLKLGADRLRQRMMRKLRPGEVLLLHDCGMTPGADEHAPANMLLALEPYLEEGTRRGFKFVGIDEMIAVTDKAKSLVPSRSKRVMIRLWLGWESLFHFVFRTIPVGSPSPSFHYRVMKYTGKTLPLNNEGDQLVKGDPIVELHFDNKLLLEMAHRSRSPIAAAIRLVREVEKRLPLLAADIQRNPEASKAKAVYGVTMIHRGADRLGFTVHALPDGLFAKMSKIYLTLLNRVLTPSSKQDNSKERVASEEVIAPHIVLFNMPDMLAMAAPAGSDSASRKDGTKARAPRYKGKQTERDKPSTLELQEEEMEGAAIGKHGG